MKSIARRIALGLLAALPLLPLAAQAQSDWPNRPVRIIVAYPPGQSTDIATRYFANKLTQALGQSFFVENKPGASGNIGTAAAARATPDGYTLVMGANGTHAINPALFANPGFDAEKDFDAIVLTALIPFAISAGPNAGVNSLTELIALARSKPGKVDVAIPSVTGQLVLEMLKQRDVPLFAVKFKGSADAMTATVGGHVPILIDTVAATRTGLARIKPLAVTTAAPMASMPGVKTAREQGLPNFTLAAWNALMVPHGRARRDPGEAGCRDAQDPGPAGNRQGPVRPGLREGARHEHGGTQCVAARGAAQLRPRHQHRPDESRVKPS